MTNDHIGVDISKDHLDAYRMVDGASCRFVNGNAGCKMLINWIGSLERRVVFEPTGPYHKALSQGVITRRYHKAFERALSAAGLPLVKVNPRQARRFAEATGKLAKTDRLDAAMLARMGALLQLQARPAHSDIPQ